MRILVAGIGNIFLGDDAFGVEVLSRLLQRELPPEVFARDFGIRSYDLAYAIMDGYEATVLVDAAPLGQPPGTLQLIEPDLDNLARLDGPAMNAHGLDPVSVLQLVRSLGGQWGRLYVVACQPGALETEEIGLSEPVRSAVPQAVEMIVTLIDDLLRAEEKAALALFGTERR